MNDRELQESIAAELLDAMPQDEWMQVHRDKIITICGYNGYDAPMVVALIKLLESKK